MRNHPPLWIDPAFIAQVRALWHAGHSTREVARALGSSQTVVLHALHGKTWTPKVYARDLVHHCACGARVSCRGVSCRACGAKRKSEQMRRHWQQRQNRKRQQAEADLPAELIEAQIAAHLKRLRARADRLTSVQAWAQRADAEGFGEP